MKEKSPRRCYKCNNEISEESDAFLCDDCEKKLIKSEKRAKIIKYCITAGVLLVIIIILLNTLFTSANITKWKVTAEMKSEFPYTKELLNAGEISIETEPNGIDNTLSIKISDGVTTEQFQEICIYFSDLMQKPQFFYCRFSFLYCDLFDLTNDCMIEVVNSPSDSEPNELDPWIKIYTPEDSRMILSIMDPLKSIDWIDPYIKLFYLNYIDGYTLPSPQKKYTMEISDIQITEKEDFAEYTVILYDVYDWDTLSAIEKTNISYWLYQECCKKDTNQNHRISVQDDLGQEILLILGSEKIRSIYSFSLADGSLDLRARSTY